ncbi:MAG TPA: PEP-CTERM sorting domain-containing protein [Verrucomicrobiae bacterium]|nr:PEP-CTERM sorting domain-containing protein [Verrucomicrobiae bacterium]
MNVKCVSILVATVLVTFAGRALTLIEPDGFSGSTILNHVSPQVSLITAGEDNVPFPFDVTASYDGFGYTSTGTNVFGHAGIPFWNNYRRLRMDFSNPANFIAIDFIGGWSFTNDTGRMDVFNSAGTLLESYITSPLAAGSIETMTISRPAGDIAWAVAYVPLDGGDFGRLDNLRFMVVPEPGVAVLLLLGGSVCLRRNLARR